MTGLQHLILVLYALVLPLILLLPILWGLTILVNWGDVTTLLIGAVLAVAGAYLVAFGINRIVPSRFRVPLPATRR